MGRLETPELEMGGGGGGGTHRRESCSQSGTSDPPRELGRVVGAVSGRCDPSTSRTRRRL